MHGCLSLLYEVSSHPCTIYETPSAVRTEEVFLPPLHLPQDVLSTHTVLLTSAERHTSHLAPFLSTNEVTSEPTVQLAFTDEMCQALRPVYTLHCYG